MKSAVVCLILLRRVHGYIYPVMQCSNDKALPHECGTEVKGAIDAVAPWFHPYIVHEDENDNDRKLLECNRFCEAREYFFFHAPCDCSRRRLMQIPQERRTLAQEDDNPLEGPLQLLEKHVATLPSGHCKDVLSQSKCFLNFVTEYDKTIDSGPKSSPGGTPQDLDKLLSIPGLQLIEAEEYDPLTHEATLIDVETGKKTPIEATDFDHDNTTPSTQHEINGLTVIEEEKYDPVTGTATTIPGEDDPRGEDPTDVVDDPGRIDGSDLDGAHPDPDDIGNTSP